MSKIKKEAIVTITFRTTVQPSGWAIECACGAANHVISYTAVGDAYDAINLGVKPLCGDEQCAEYTATVIDIYNGSIPPEVNMSNENAHHIMDLLSIEFDYSGEIDASDLIGRALTAQAFYPEDAGVPVITDGNSVHFGREVGYADDKFVGIEAVAEYAIANNLAVVWS